MTSSPVLLANFLELPRMLRRVGLPLSTEQVIGFFSGLRWVDLANRKQVFHASRALLVLRKEDLTLFEIIFHRFWSLHRGGSSEGQRAPTAPRHDRKPDPRPNVVQLMAARASASAPEVDVVDRQGTWSPTEALQRKDFGAMTTEELAAVRQLMQKMQWRVSERKTRRWQSARQGPALHLRKVLRDVARYGAAPRLAHRQRKVKQRPLVLLADISGSMEIYSRLILQFFYSVVQGLDEVEAFVFGTRLTRVTSALGLRNIDRALDEASREVADWAGGTRIGASLQAFNRRWARRVLGRGAVVVLVSDGWERGEAQTLAREMRQLQRRCHRLVWLNPHRGQPGYRPLVGGMAAALPFVDDFLPVHNLQSLHQLAEHLGSLPSRRPLRRAAGTTAGAGA